jgi:hypothetical protein
MNGEVIGERRGRGSSKVKVGRVVRNANSGSNKRVVIEGKGKKEPVKPRGPRKRRRRVTGDVKKSMGVVRGVKDLEDGFKIRPGL